MLSLFDLKTSTSQLKGSNEATTRMTYEQHAPTRDVTGTSFPNGPIHFRFQCSGQKWWVPQRSYFRLRCSYTGGAVARLAKSVGIGPNMGVCGNLFQSGEFRINDKSVSRISDYFAQIEALENRKGQTKAWLDSVGNSTNYWQSDINERINLVSSDGKSQAVQPSSYTSLNHPATAFTALSTMAYTIATETYTIAVAGGTASLAVGDVITFSLPAGLAGVKTTIVSILGAQTFVGSAGPAADVAAGVTAFTIERANDSSARAGIVELIWKPSLSIFKIDHALPAGKYEIVLNPQTLQAYKLRAIESLAANPVISAAGVVDFSVDDMYLEVAVVDGMRFEDGVYLIDLEETRCQSDNITNNFEQKNFDVSPGTYALTAAYQVAAAGTDALYSASKFKMASNEDLNLNRFFIQYAGQNKPQPDADPSYVVASGTDRMTQRYVESIMQTGGYYASGGTESLEEWKKRGPYYHFLFPRDGQDRSTRVQIHSQFSAAHTVASRVLLFDHFRKMVQVQVMDGRVVDCQIREE